MCRREAFALAVAVLLAGGACNQNETMARRGRIKPLEGIRGESVALPGRVSHAWRPPVPGTVARDELRDAPEAAQPPGIVAGQGFPLPITHALLERGRSRFDIYCMPCHSASGDGDGMVVLRGFARPPSLHTENLRQVPVAHVFEVITAGIGAMPGYAGQIRVADRWAIVAYVRALQLSRYAPLAELPADVRAELPPPEGQR